MKPHAIGNAVLVPLGGIHLLRRECGVIEHITDIAVHPGGFVMYVVRHWWTMDDTSAESTNVVDAVVDLATATFGDVEDSSI